MQMPGIASMHMPGISSHQQIDAPRPTHQL